jgi:hypothetical protein
VVESVADDDDVDSGVVDDDGEDAEGVSEESRGLDPVEKKREQGGKEDETNLDEENRVRR